MSTTVTGNINDLTGTAVTSNCYVRFWLRGCNGNQPRVGGSALIAPDNGPTYFQDLVPNGSGQISGTLYSNDVNVSAGGQVGVTWYGVQVFLNGIPGAETPYSLADGVTFNLNSATPISTNPVVAAPTGDSTYLRKDGGNMPAASLSVTGNATIGGTFGVTGATTIPKLDGACYLDGTTNTTLAAVVTCAGTNGVIIIPPFASPTLTGNVTIPSGVTIIFQGGNPGQITLGNFNLTINGSIIAPVAQIFLYSGTGRVTLGVGAVGEDVHSEWFPGTTWCDQANAADASFAAVGGTFLVGQNPNTASCGANISISASHVMKASAGFYNLGSQSIVPNGIGASTICDSWLTNFNYTGTGWAYDVNTQTQTHLHDCQISLGTTALGAIRLRNTGNSFETRAYIRDVYISAGVWTAGQIGVLFQADNALSANYHSEVEVQTQNVDIGAEFKSLVNNQGPNANRLSVRTNGHTVGVQHFDGTDNIISGTILGAKGGGNGIAFNFCATGNGGYGSANNIIGPFSTEQGATGGASKTVNIASSAGLTVGCGNSVVFGQSNDGTPFTDANGAAGTFNVHMNTNTITAVPIVVPVGTAAACSVQDIANAGTGIFFSSGGQMEVATLGTAHVMFSTTGPTLGSDMVVGWRSVTDPNGSPDTGWSRSAAKVIAVGNGTQGDTSGTLKAAALLSGGAAAGLTGTGACATITTQTGGSFAGRATCTGTTGASTFIVTPGTTATNGWVCYVQDQTTRANLLQQTSNSQTSCTLTATSVTQNDVLVFTAIAF